MCRFELQLMPALAAATTAMSDEIETIDQEAPMAEHCAKLEVLLSK
jgi:hypothetical protein